MVPFAFQRRALCHLLFRLFFPWLIGLALLPDPGLAQSETPPQDTNAAILLTVTGLNTADQNGTRTFDRDALAALGAVQFTTTSIWTEGRHSFTGVPLSTLAKALNLAADDRILLQALNDYEVEMPLSEARSGAPVLAYEMDGKPMSVRDKGPIWVVYPYDSDPAAYQTVTTFARSVWQLDRIRVLP